MSGPANDLPGFSCAEILEHPLRQTLFILLRHRAATAPELQEVVKQPLRRTDFHLRLMVRHECLVAETRAGATTYRIDPRASFSASSPHSVEDRRRFLALSMLDAAWSTIGKSPESVSLRPRWEVFHLDDGGLVEASAVATDALAQIERIARKGGERRAGDAAELPMHVLVAVASLVEPAASGGGKGDA